MTRHDEHGHEPPTQPQRAALLSPAGEAGGGLMAQVESQRAMAELRAFMSLADARPRDEEKAAARALALCDGPAFAELAVYEFARGGNEIRGLSVRAVQALARVWGNMWSNLEEQERANGQSVVVAYACDTESGYLERRRVIVRHWRDTRSGGYPLRDERDIRELVASVGQRVKRAVVETVLPPELQEAAFKRCEQTVVRHANLSGDGVAKLLEAFEEFGVTRAHIEARIQRKAETMTPRQFLGLRKLYVALRDGVATPAELFQDAPATRATPGGNGAPPPPPPPPAGSGRARARDAVRERGKPEPTSPPAAPPPDDGAPPPDDEGGESGEQAEPVPTLSNLRAALLAAVTEDAGQLVMDRARSLGAQEREALQVLFDRKFGG